MTHDTFATIEDTLGRMARYRRAVALSSHITWKLGEWFPRAFPLVYVTGFPKSGTVWVTQLVSDVLRLPFPQISVLPVGCPAVVHGHQPPSAKRMPGVYVLRDGRDAMTSLYFHLARRIPAGDRPQLTRTQRRDFPGLVNKANVRGNLPAFLEAQFKKPHATGGLTWADHARRYFEGDIAGLPLVRFEDLLADTAGTLTGAIETMTGREADAWAVETAVTKFAFKKQTKRARGEENRAAFLRKGQSGDWRNHFTREAAEILDDHCGEMLRAAGYVADSSWIDTADAAETEAAPAAAA